MKPATAACGVVVVVVDIVATAVDSAVADVEWSDLSCWGLQSSH